MATGKALKARLKPSLSDKVAAVVAVVVVRKRYDKLEVTGGYLFVYQLYFCNVSKHFI